MTYQDKTSGAAATLILNNDLNMLGAHQSETYRVVIKKNKTFKLKQFKFYVYFKSV